MSGDGSCGPLFDTRRQAAAVAEGFAAGQRSRILAAIIASGRDGLTADDIEARLSMAGNSVRPRLVELAAAGEVVRDGRTRRTRSNRLALLFFAAGVLP